MLRGRVVSAATQEGVKGAHVFITGNTLSHIKTDSSGRYQAELETGEYTVSIQHHKFRSQVRKNIILHAGKHQVQDFELEDLSVALDTVRIAPGNYNDAINLDTWNTQRFAAAFYDPARIVSSHAAAINTDDQANNISIHGTSPNYMQWKIEGIEVVNPNHLENAGTINDRPAFNGGGVSMLSAQLLQHSSFQLAPFESSSGNSLTGIFDIKLRRGNNEQSEHIVQASFLGTDICLEGPLSNRKKSSYLVNFRYSTIGLLNKLGVNFGGEKINYADISYTLAFPGEKSFLKFFGVNGTSENIFKGKRDSAAIESQKDLQDIDYHSQTMINGLSYLRTISSSSYFKTVIGYSHKTTDRNAIPSSERWTQALTEEDRYTQNKISTLSYYSKRITDGLNVKMGSYINYFISNIYSSQNSLVYSNGTIYDPVIQPYLLLEGIYIDNIKMESGLHSLYQPRVKRFVLQPRYKITFLLSKMQDISFNYGKHAQIQPATLYLASDQNYMLGPTTSNNFSLVHRIDVNTISVKSSLFMEFYKNIPTSADGFSAFNYFNGPVSSSLSNSGKAKVYGFDLNIEKSIQDFYILLSTSIYNSIYNINSDSYAKGRFNTGYNAAITGGKEFRFKDGKRFFGINMRGMFRNGFREPSTDLTSGYLSYPGSYPSYFRTDLRISYRKNRTNSSHIWAIDIQNLSNQKNISYYYYDQYTKKTETRYQLGLIPVLSFKAFF